MKKRTINLKDIMNSSNEKGEKKMSYSELYKVISKPWVNTKEIQYICQCGIRRATSIRQEIEQQVEEIGSLLPKTANKIIPTPLLLKYMNISENYIYEMAKKEKMLESVK